MLLSVVVVTAPVRGRMAGRLHPGDRGHGGFHLCKVEKSTGGRPLSWIKKLLCIPQLLSDSVYSA